MFSGRFANVTKLKKFLLNPNNSVVVKREDPAFN